ncbi:MAG: 4Fe-4S single cluster domain-containing protein [Oscillospiraceae bacterium]
MTDKIIHTLADNGKIRIGWCVERTKCLGPFERFALWLQGCNRNCTGCIAPDMQPLTGGRQADIDYLAELVINSKTEGITISGGEPFYQADKLVELLDTIKSKIRDFGVIIYSGFSYNQLINSGEQAVLDLIHRHVDLLIDGEYIQALDDDLGIRGSSNQRLIFMTERYKFAENELNDGRARQVDFFIRENNRIQMVGVPSEATKTAIARINNAAAIIASGKNKKHSEE